MWQPLINDRFGFMKTFSDIVMNAVRTDPYTLPNLYGAPTIITTSDYSGQHKASKFESYAFLFVNSEAWPNWERRRQWVREAYKVEGRRISFKKLGDSLKRRMLPDFLQAANMLPGLCVCILIDKSIASMFRKEGPLDSSEPELVPFAHYSRDTFEKLLRIVHLQSFFLAGMTRPGQNVLWFTDEDDIAANENGLVELTRIWSNVFGNYLQHDLGHIRCGTTQSDDGSLQVEDLAAVPDLVAGALAEAVNSYVAEGTLPAGSLIVPPPESMSLKAQEIIDWLADERWPLRRLTYCFVVNQGSTDLIIKRLRFHGVEVLA